MKVILNPNKVIVGKGQEVYPCPEGIYCDGMIYIEPHLQIAEIPDDVSFAISRHKFVNGAVVPNEDFIEPFDKVEQLESQLTDIEQAITELSILIGGVM